MVTSAIFKMWTKGFGSHGGEQIQGAVRKSEGQVSRGGRLEN